MNRIEHLKSIAVESGIIEGLEYFIAPSPLMSTGQSGLNGYIIFPQRPVKVQGYGGILHYVPVHGGITFADNNGESWVYGFDTAHHDSENFPRTEPQWIKGQIEIMRQGILLAATLEDQYLLAEGDNEKRAEICDQILALQRDQQMNFHTMLSLLTGSL